MEKKKKTATKKKNSKAVHALQKNEKRYTYFFVGFFVFLLLYFGYHLFLVPDNLLTKMQKTSATISVEPVEDSVDLSTISISSELVTLTENNIMNDEEGRNSSPYVLTIKNNTDDTVSFHVLLKEDSVMKNRCGCEGKYLSYLRYEIDGEVNNYEDKPFLYEGELGPKEEKKIPVTLWFKNDLLNEDNLHFHGQFFIEV